MIVPNVQALRAVQNALQIQDWVWVGVAIVDLLYRTQFFADAW